MDRGAPTPIHSIHYYTTSRRKKQVNSKLIYSALCQQGKLLQEKYQPDSGLHRHHILPKHSGGTDCEDNYTYLTARHHTLAHYLLWRIYRNPNDLRAMKMLGANLTPIQRRTVGLFCKENKLGFHGATKQQRLDWSMKGLETQKNMGTKQSFYYWSTEQGRKERASLGGQASIKSGNNPKFMYWISPEGRNERASLGGKAHTGKIWVTNGEHRTRILPDLLPDYIDKGYVKGKGTKHPSS